MAKKTTKKTGKKRSKKAASKTLDAPNPKHELRTPAPIPLGEVIGQDRAVGVLRAAVESDRLHHAWIFHGPPGVGKFTTAMAFAAMVLDPTTAPQETLIGPGELAPDRASETQTLLRAGTHPDLHVIVKELARFSSESRVRDSKLATIPKDVIDQHLIRPAKLAPVMSHETPPRATKVFIIDEAELMDRSPTNAPVQNAILKTLEEPPPGTVIILVTSSEDRLLPTIRSRCQRVAFTPLNDEAMARWVERASIDAGGAELEWLIGHAEGSPGKLVRARETGLYAWHRTLSPMLEQADRGELPLTLGSTMAELVDSWAKDWVSEGSSAGENRSKEAANRAGASQMFALVARRYRGQLAEPKAAMPAVRAIDLVGRAERLLGSNVSLKLVMDDLAVGLSGR
ncbi:MAG: AAA family ATPase [Phycisphaerales bacterium]